MKTRLIFCEFLLVVSAFISNAEAFEILTYEDVTIDTTGRYDEMKWWWEDNIVFHVEASSIPEDSRPIWRSLERAVERFNDNPSNISVSLASYSGGSRFNNGQSDIWMDRTYDHPAATYIQALILFLPPHDVILGIEESDIKIRGDSLNDDWTDSYTKSDLRSFGGPHRPLIATALHEMGHAVGLGHVNYEYNIMGVDYMHLHVNGDFATPYVGEDAADGLIYLYDSKPNAKEDLGVVNWKYHGSVGEYSIHEFTGLSGVSGSNLQYREFDYDSDGDTDALHWTVFPGQSVMVEFTYENNGVNELEYISVGFYLSSDAYIDRNDEKLVTANLILSRNDVYTTSHRVMIPLDTPIGQHWIGAIIDDNESISEQVEWNNATYIPIYVQGVPEFEEPNGGFIDPFPFPYH